jgi:hypothetical protein
MTIWFILVASVRMVLEVLMVMVAVFLSSCSP